MQTVTALLIALLLTLTGTLLAQEQTPPAQQTNVVETGQQEQPTAGLPPMIVPPVTVTAEAAGPVHWILPGPRGLSAEVFGTPNMPLGWQEEVGVPIDQRLTNDAGNAWASTAFPTAHSNDSQPIDGFASFQATDITALDGTTTQDDIEFTAEFTGPTQGQQQNTYRVTVTKPIPNGPTHSFFGGVGTNAFLHGSTGLGTMLQPRQFSYAFFWGVGDLYRNGELVADQQVVHVMITQRVRTSIEEGYELVHSSQVDELKGMGPQLHLILPPQKMTPNGPESRPVPTGFTLPNGEMQPFLHIMFDTVTNLTGTLAAVDPAGMAAAPVIPEAALGNLRNLLEQGVEQVSTPQVMQAFQDLRTGIEESTILQGAIEQVEQALSAEPFEQATLVQALQELALEMRRAATAGDAALLVEVASLVDQTAEFIQREGYEPRMQVEAP